MNQVRQLIFPLFFSLLATAFAQPVDPTEFASVSVASQLRQEFDLMPGSVTTGSILLTNKGTYPAQVSISPVDMVFSPEGAVQYAPAASTPASNAAWIEVASRVEVPANSTLEVPFAINVPRNSDLNGSYWSMLQIEPLRPDVFRNNSDDDAVKTSVNVAFRYVMLVLTHIGTPDRISVQFIDPLFAPDDAGQYYLEVELGNPGAFVVETESWLELYDSNGQLVKRVEGETVRTYPGATDRLTFELGELGPQVYQAVVVADAGGNSVFGARYSLDATVR